MSCNVRTHASPSSLSLACHLHSSTQPLPTPPRSAWPASCTTSTSKDLTTSSDRPALRCTCASMHTCCSLLHATDSVASTSTASCSTSTLLSTLCQLSKPPFVAAAAAAWGGAEQCSMLQGNVTSQLRVRLKRGRPSPPTASSKLTRDAAASWGPAGGPSPPPPRRFLARPPGACPSPPSVPGTCPLGASALPPPDPEPCTAAAAAAGPAAWWLPDGGPCCCLVPTRMPLTTTVVAGLGRQLSVAALVCSSADLSP
mmetsp:Transcript_24967/g.54289  ORF Transcript_24967/g.54289 Transcript_24967/m.54289 type:complete len:256 (+) Transcript_24967:137-904(+)